MINVFLVVGALVFFAAGLALIDDGHGSGMASFAIAAVCLFTVGVRAMHSLDAQDAKAASTLKAECDSFLKPARSASDTLYVFKLRKDCVAASEVVPK